MSHSYGWRRSLPDHRDLRYSVRPSVMRSLPEAVDLRDKCPSVWDQGQLGSCTANAVGAVHQFVQMKQGSMVFQPSRLFLYYNTRVIEGTVPYDAGATMRESMKSAVKYGVCPEEQWPYEISRFAISPDERCYDVAELNQGLIYCGVEQTLCAMQGVLATGFPFVLGFSVFESFEDVGPDGIVRMPTSNESLLGGHAVVAVGYDNATRRFTIRNSWGSDWGADGYCYMPYEYLTNSELSADFWVLSVVEEGNA